MQMEATMTAARMANPATILPDTVPAVQQLLKATRESGVPEKTLELVHLRASQINGCSFCVDYGARAAMKEGETAERLIAVSAWRESPYFTEAERAALELSEQATRLADKGEAVSDDVWNAAAAHYDEKQLAGLVLMIAITNFFNRMNATIRQPAGVTW